MRRSNRIAGQHPAEDPQTHLLNKLLSLRNSRRAQLSSLTRVINQIFMCLNEGDVQNAFVLQETMLTTYLRFRATNTEYLSIETDHKKILECEESERRESNRIAEVEREIRGRTRASSVGCTRASSIHSSIQGSCGNYVQSECASSGGSGGSGYHSPNYFVERSSSPRSENVRNARFPNPSPPSVSSLTAKSRSSFRRLRQTPSRRAFSDSSSQSSGTFVTQNPTSVSKPQKTFLQSIDNFIEDLVEGEETCLAGLSNPVTASAALRYEFESKTLPIIELIKFNGDSAKWPEFIENFSRRVHFKLSFTDNDRMERLLSVLTGEARKSVQCIGTSGIFYATALKSLKRDFGNTTVVTHAKLKILLDKPQLVANDRVALKGFHQHLKSTVTWLKRIGNISAIHSTENLSKAVMRLPDNLRKNFYKKSKDFDDTDLSLLKLETFLDATLKEFYNPIADIIASQEGKVKRERLNRNKEGQSNHIGAEGAKFSCWLCQKPHKIWACEEFKKKPVPDRRKIIMDQKCCFNCLSNKHMVKECKSKWSCKDCKKRHHSSLHDPNFEVSQGHQSNYGKTTTNTYLQVIPVTISNGNISVEVNALLDTGSDTTLIKSSLADQLKLTGKGRTLTMSNVLTNKQTVQSKSVNFLIGPSSLTKNSSQSSIPIQDAWVVESLNVKMKPYNLSKIKKTYHHLKDIPLVQPLKGDVEILIGADTPEALLHLRYVKGESTTDPLAVKTIFGWTLFGGRSSIGSISANFLSFDRLEASVERFWEQESYATIPKLSPAILTRDEKRALSLLNKGTSLVEGRCEVAMLWKEDEVRLENNRFLAQKRLVSTERRLEKFPVIKQIYHEKIQEYVTLGHVKKLTNEEARMASNKTNYIPHHFVLEPKKPGKIRIVFDASSKFNGSSLNCNLLPGPNLLNNLVTVLSGFRRGRIAVISDIEKMYHQVLVPSEDQDSLRFLWRDDSSQPIAEYKMLVHLFGKIDSPCCANWALRSCVTELDGIARAPAFEDLPDERKDRITEAVTEKFYMDDFLDSFDETEEAKETCQDLKKVVNGRHFRLTKWLSNDSEFIKSMPEEDRSPKIVSLELNKLPHERTLGVWWNPCSDEFFFNVKLKDHHKTKRGLLSFLSSIYDPLGFLAPLLVKPKTILQSMWRQKVGWDDPLPNNLLSDYKEWLTTLSELKDVRVPRWFGFPIKIDNRDIELHIFSDASLKAFSACAYFRTVKNENVTCTFIIGKSRLAPIKGSTIPRLELQAGVLASRMKDCINGEMGLPIGKTYMWSDSMVVLSYIRNEEKRFSTYVMNRTNEIREKTNVQDWNFVPGKLNPADMGTRPLQDIIEDEPIVKWIDGPGFLKRPQLPNFEEDDRIDPLPEEITKSVSTASIQKLEDQMTGIIRWEKFSNWVKIKRAYAWVIKLKKRWIQIKRHGDSETDISSLDTQDLEEATKELCRIAQEESKASLSEQKLMSLKPTIHEGLLRVGGRLTKALLPTQAKHQIILSKEHPISVLIIRHTHETNHHVGRDTTLSLIRVRFWITSAKSKIRQVLSRCFFCKRESAKARNPLMADLPLERIDVGCHTFINVGVDYFGPILVKQGRRTRKSPGAAKRYGALFTCMTTRSVHLELAGDLSTDSFILALRRFRARRGNPKLIRSDNGTNFVGAERELREALRGLDQGRIKNELSTHDIEWRFNPPVAPWMGGAMESMVKLTKRALRSSMKERVFTEEALHTMLLEVESTLNSRPLTSVSDDVNDFEALTPNHFLLGRRSLNLPIVDDASGLRSKWKQVQEALKLFWSRWVKEYLPSLQRRGKWTREMRNMQPGDLVTVNESNIPRCKWPLARVVAVTPSSDGRTRVAVIRMSDGSTYTRAVGKLALLEAAQ